MQFNAISAIQCNSIQLLRFVSAPFVALWVTFLQFNFLLLQFAVAPPWSLAPFGANSVPIRRQFGANSLLRSPSSRFGVARACQVGSFIANSDANLLPWADAFLLCDHHTLVGNEWTLSSEYVLLMQLVQFLICAGAIILLICIGDALPFACR